MFSAPLPGTPAPWFVDAGVGPEMITGGEPRLRRYTRTGEGPRGWILRTGALLRSLRPAGPRIAVLGR